MCLQKRVLQTGAPPKRSKIEYCHLFYKMWGFWVPRGVPGEGPNTSFFKYFFAGAPFGLQGGPRAAAGSPPGCFFTDFGMDLCTCWAPRDAFLKVLGSICAPHTVQNQAEFRVKNFPGNPEKKNAIAVPFERCTDDVNNQAEYSVKNLIANS